MNETPSKIRRKGREAFIPDENPMDYQPYTKGTFSYNYKLTTWIEGWKDEEKEYKAGIIQESNTVTYVITKETIDKVLNALSNHIFSEDGEYNNDDVIDAEEDLRDEIKSQ